MKTKIKLLLVNVLLTSVLSLQAQELKGKKAYYINAYHPGYTWSDAEENGVVKTLKPLGVEVKITHMDSLRNNTPEHLAKIVAECNATIDTWKPDVVIVSDDFPMKAIFLPFYKDKELPFVFCGVNWSAEAYGVPCKNVTGMLELCLVKDLLSEMNKLKPGKTIGFLCADSLSPRKDAEYSGKELGVALECVYAKDFTAWKKGFLDLQSKVDLLIVGPNMGIAEWDEAAAIAFVEANTKVVTGSFNDFLNNLALVSFNKLPSEQGEWAGQTAVKVLKGTPAGSIPLASNQTGELVVNARIAKKIGVTPSYEMLQSAKIIE